MKTTFFSVLIGLAITASLVAAEAPTAPNYKKALSSVSALELPAKAAALVKDAPAKDREVITAAVVNNAAAIKPMTLPAVVGAIAKSSPDMAATAAAVAASAQPKLALEIARAAAAAAPAQAKAVVTAVCKVLPMEYQTIAVAVAQIAPDSANGILIASTPAPSITPTPPTVRPPSVGSPYNPLPEGGPSTGSVTNSGTVPPGGRDYSGP
jgi:hypothetical protein